MVNRDFIFLMRSYEAEFFAQLLCAGGNCRAAWAEDEATLREVAQALPNARLISFCSDVIVSADIIASLNGGCFNFHSGPPLRPGYRPYAFALADGDTEFGVTFHSMIAEVDAGAIYAVRRFPIDPSLSEEALSALVYERLLSLSVELAPSLTARVFCMPPSGDAWGILRGTRKAYLALRSTT